MIDVHNMTGAALVRLRGWAGVLQKDLAAELGISVRKLRNEEAADKVTLIVARAARDYWTSKNLKKISADLRLANTDIYCNIIALEEAYRLPAD